MLPQHCSAPGYPQHPVHGMTRRLVRILLISIDLCMQILTEIYQTQTDHTRFKSRRAIISETGGDIEDTFEEIAADNQLAESKWVFAKAIDIVEMN